MRDNLDRDESRDRLEPVPNTVAAACWVCLCVVAFVIVAIAAGQQLAAWWRP